MALNAYARSLTDRAVVPIARALVRTGVTANGITLTGLVMTLVGCAVVLQGRPGVGAVVLAAAVVTDAFDGTVARLRGSANPTGAFFDSVADRVSDSAILSTVAWLVRDDTLLLGLALAALCGALLTSYIRAKAESLGWQATVGLIERPERLILIIPAIGLALLEVALWLLVVGSLITVVQRLLAVVAQARQA